MTGWQDLYSPHELLQTGRLGLNMKPEVGNRFTPQAEPLTVLLNVPQVVIFNL